MATIYDLSLLAQSVYGDVPTPTGWTCLKLESGSYGFQAGAYTRGSETVVAFRGTTPTAGDFVADAMLGAGMNTSHFGQADDFLDDYRQIKGLTLCGHSLGGAMAQVAGNRGRLPFATFNAPGVGVIASRNLDEVATTVAIGTAKIRAGMVLVSAVLHPIQAARDIAATFHVCRGVNICLNADLVSRIGVHYGKVIRIAGTAATPWSQHGIATVVEVLGAPGCTEGLLSIDSYFPPA
jgi:pimeloyl-ACP methyl ester carboxylesterase